VSERAQLTPELEIKAVRVTRWEDGKVPQHYDREHPEKHPGCLEVVEIRDGVRFVIYQREGIR
jgi:hypothetical protein